MGQKPKNADVRLEDILPNIHRSIISESILSLTDIFINPDKIDRPPDWHDDCSFEYDFVIPIDMEKALNNNVVGLEVTLRNQSDIGDPDKKPFKTIISLLGEVENSIDVGEDDFKTLLSFIKKVRKISYEQDLISDNAEKINKYLKRASGAMTIFKQESPSSTLNFNKESFDAIIPGSVNKKESEVTLEKDYHVKPPKRVSDGLNRRGVSLVQLKDEVLEKEFAEGKYPDTSKSDYITTILEPDFSRNQTQDDITYLEYSSPVIPIRRLLKVNIKNLVPYDDIIVAVRPVLRQGIKDYGAVTRKFYVNSRAEDVYNLLVPVGVPDFTITRCAPGYISGIIRKNDPSLLSGGVSITYVNPFNPSQIVEGITKEYEINQPIQSFEIKGILNVYPIKTRATFFTLNANGEIVKTKTIEIKPFKSSISYMLPDMKSHIDSLRLTALSLPNGISVTFEGEIEGAAKIELYREDLSTSPGNLLKAKKVFETTSGPDGTTFVDNNVVKNRVYKYYALYERIGPARPHTLASDENNRPRVLGQGVLSVTKHRSVDEVIIKYKNSNALSGVSVDQPLIVTDRGLTKVFVGINYPNTSNSLTLSAVLENAKNDQASLESEIGIDEKSLSEEVLAAIVERINRVTGEEKQIGVFFLNKEGKTSIVDEDLFKNGSENSITGKFTYKVKICRPTISALYNLEIPVKKSNQGSSNQTEKVNGIKYTSNIFYDEGILINTVKASQDYVELLKSFDTGERIYKNFDLEKVGPMISGLISSIGLSVTPSTNGDTIKWTIPNTLVNVIDAYLIYRHIKGKRSLVGSVKSNAQHKTYSYLASFSNSYKSKGIDRNYSYSLTPVGIDGKIFPSTEPKSSQTTLTSGIKLIAKTIPTLDKVTFPTLDKITFK